MRQTKQNIAPFIHALSDIPEADYLVHTPGNSEFTVPLNHFFDEKWTVPLDATWKKIYQTAAKYRTEADVSSLCVAAGFLHWKHQEKNKRTPLFLFPLNWTYSRLQQTLTFTIDVSGFELNPYVEFILEQHGLSNQLPTFEATTPQALWNEFQSMLAYCPSDWKLETTSEIGNFHYHRFHILRELKTIQQAENPVPLLHEIMGETVAERPALELDSHFLVPTDADQREVFTAFSKSNLVLHGPPGTGKSQVLINLLGKSLASAYKTLVVSEKKVALEVLVKKLHECDLAQYAYVFHAQTSARDFISHLKNTWEFIENHPRKQTLNLQISEHHLANMQLVFDRMNASEFFAGVTYQKAKQLQKESQGIDTTYSSFSPDLADWLKHKETLITLSEKWNGFHFLNGLKPQLLKQQNGDSIIHDLIQRLSDLQHALPNVTNIHALEVAFSQIGRCQLVENESFKAYSSLLEKPREYKKFQQNITRYKILLEEWNRVKEEADNWKKLPTKSHLDSWTSAHSWLARKRRNASIKRLLHDQSIEPEIALNNIQQFIALSTEKAKAEQYFTHLGINPSISDLNLSVHYLKLLQKESASALKELADWPSIQRKNLLAQERQIQALLHDFKTFFNIQPEADLKSFLQHKKRIFEELVKEHKSITSLPDCYFLLFPLAADWKSLQALIVHSNWVRMENISPELTQFDAVSWAKKLSEYLKLESEEQVAFQEQIHYYLRKKFESYHAILRENPTKLNDSDRELRKRLKVGKALLVKEFSKKKAHLSFRQLFQSDAQLWIQLLNPLFLATPFQVSEKFPCQQELFDLVVFDEASQIPLPNALGSLYRSKYCIVAGDDQQMSPSTYFGKNYGFPDLLSQAIYYFKKVNLRHHYRSSNPELIAFSNTHFYNNELIVYPSANMKQTLFHHEVKGGIYVNRSNVVEANAVGDFLKNQINWGEQSIGIVAFSEQQLQSIWKSCSADIQQKITEGIEQNQVFFKSLENVQGDEADILVVSLGYSKDEQGEFSMRFGPLNQANGYKRLNVLLTRAKEELHFFTSVKATDFKLSSNEAVNLLRLFLTQLESSSQAKKHEIALPFHLNPKKYNNKELEFSFINNEMKQVQELVVFHRVMTQRKWKITYSWD